jgi:hypothetical protein
MEPLASEFWDFRVFGTSKDFTSAHPQHPLLLIFEHFLVTFGDLIISCHFGVMKLRKVLPFVPYEPPLWSVNSADFAIGGMHPLRPMDFVLGLRY